MSEVKLPAGWVEIKCSEFCSGRNKTFNPSTARESSYVLYSVPSHATGQPEVVTPKEIGSSKQHVSAGDTLISKINPRLNRTWVVGEHPNQTVIASTEWIVFAASEAFIPAFLALFLQQARVRDFLSHNASGVGGSLTRIKPAIFDQVSLPLPPLAEQKRIVAKIEELFSELDAGEESLRRARRQLGVYRQSLLKQAFEGKLTAPWRAQHPDLLESPAIESVASSDPLPAHWRSIKLGSVIENPSYGTSKKCSYESQGLGVLRIPNVVNGSIDAADLKFAEFTEDEVASYALQAGDLLMIRSNGSVSIVGRCALIEPKHTGLLYAGYLIRLRPTKSLIDPLFLRFQLGSLSLRSQIEFSAKSTSGVNNINSKEIQRLVIALPSLPEQQEIVRLLDAQFEVIEQNEREIDAALKRSEALRQSILKKAFTGQLVAQDPTDEPASALLERIGRERAGFAKPGRKAAPNAFVPSVKSVVRKSP